MFLNKLVAILSAPINSVTVVALMFKAVVNTPIIALMSAIPTVSFNEIESVSASI